MIINENLMDLINGLQDTELAPSIHEDYSGRGMYGKKCLGISGDFTSGELFAEILTLLQWEDDLDAMIQELKELFEDMRTDSLGRGTIYYFPRFQVPEDYVPADEREEWTE